MKIEPHAQTSASPLRATPRPSAPEAPSAPVDLAVLGGPFQPTSGNEVYTLTSGEEVLSGATAAMSSARHGIRLEMYRLGHPQLVGVLSEQARQGVDVQVLLDPSVYDEDHRVRRDAMVEELRASGVEVGFYPIPPSERRIDHVKLLIVDNKYALIGGMNWDTHSPKNVDQGVLVRGPSVADANQIFEHGWKLAGETPRPLPPAPPPPAEPEPIDGRLPIDRDATITFARTEGVDGRQDIRPMLMDRIRSAQRSIYIEAFALADKEIIAGLGEAVERGVDVRVLLDPNQPIVHQNRKSAELLKQAGVEVRWLDAEVDIEEKDHSKMMLVDDDVTILGSANFTYAGLAINHEANAEIVSKAVGAAFSELFEQRWRERSVEKPPVLPDYQERVAPEPPVEQYARQLLKSFSEYFHPDSQRNWTGKRKQAILSAVEAHRGRTDLRFSDQDAEEVTLGKLAAHLEAGGLTRIQPEPGAREKVWRERQRIAAEAAPEVASRAPERMLAMADAVGDPALAEIVRKAQAAAPQGYRGAPAGYRPDRFPADSMRPADLDYKPGGPPYRGGGRVLADRRAQQVAASLARFQGLSEQETAQVMAALAVRNLCLGVTARDLRKAKDTTRVDWKPWEADRDRQAASALLDRIGVHASHPLRKLVEMPLTAPPDSADPRHLVMFLAVQLSEHPHFYTPVHP